MPHTGLHECTGWGGRLPEAEDGAAFLDDGNRGAMDGPEAVDDGELTMAAKGRWG